MSFWGFRENVGCGRAPDMTTWVVFCSATQAAIHLDYSVKGASWGCARTLWIAVGSGPRGEGRAVNQDGSKQTRTESIFN